MIKDIIEETTASIESKMTGLLFSLAAGLTVTAVLAYGVIKLIWYFEEYLILNYGTGYAVFLIVAVIAVALAPLIYTKIYYETKAIHARKEAELKAPLPQHREGLGEILAMPEKIVHQAFMGFLDGLSGSRRKSKPVLQDANGYVEAAYRDVVGRDFIPNTELNIERMRTTAAR